MSSRPLFTSDAEFSVFIGPMFQVGWAPACSGVTLSRSAADQPRNGPPEAVSTSLATSFGLPRAQALRERGVLGVDGHDLARLGGLEHQRAAGDQRLLVGQRQPRAAVERGQRRLQPERTDQRIEHDVGLGVAHQLGGGVGTAVGASPTASAALSSATATLVTPVASRWSASSCALAPPAARPTTSNRSGFAAMTSSAWVPIEPVLPRMSTRMRLLTRLLCPGQRGWRPSGLLRRADCVCRVVGGLVGETDFESVA